MAKPTTQPNPYAKPILLLGITTSVILPLALFGGALMGLLYIKGQMEDREQFYSRVQSADANTRKAAQEIEKYVEVRKIHNRLDALGVRSALNQISSSLADAGIDSKNLSTPRFSYTSNPPFRDVDAFADETVALTLTGRWESIGKALYAIENAYPTLMLLRLSMVPGPAPAPISGNPLPESERPLTLEANYALAKSPNLKPVLANPEATPVAATP